MEQNQNTSNPQSPPHSNTNHEFLLQSHILQQGQGINILHNILNSNSIVRGFKTVLSVLLEILMYLLFIGAILLIIFTQTNPIVNQQIGANISTYIIIQSDAHITMSATIKIIILLISFPILLCAILLRRNRKKSALINRAFAQAEILKRNFEQLK